MRGSLARAVLRRAPMLSSRRMGREVQVVYGVPESLPGWELSEEKMPESDAHDETVELLEAILSWWARGRSDVQIARNLAIRWNRAAPRVGVEPDVCVLWPRPPRPESDVLARVRTWLPGHAPPRLAIEVVSDSDPRKDYAIAPDKYAASGTEELWIFDPLLAGPTAHGGPRRLQIWQRSEGGRFERTYEGEGPARSALLGAYAVVTDEGRRLRIADDPEGTALWPTEAEAERAEKEAALARVAELEARLRGRS